MKKNTLQEKLIGWIPFFRKYRGYFVSIIVCMLIRLLPGDIHIKEYYFNSAINELSSGASASLIIALCLQVEADKHKKEVMDRTEQQFISNLIKNIMGYYYFQGNYLISYNRAFDKWDEKYTIKEIGYASYTLVKEQNILNKIDYECFENNLNSIYDEIKYLKKILSLHMIQDGISNEAREFVNQLDELFRIPVTYLANDDIGSLCLINEINKNLPNILNQYEITKELANKRFSIHELADYVY